MKTLFKNFLENVQPALRHNVDYHDQVPTGADHYMIDQARIEGKFIRQSEPEIVRQANREIREQLGDLGIDFENMALPISLMPTTVSSYEVRELVDGASAIRNALNRIVLQFVVEHRKGELNGPLHRFFKPYEKWFDLIAYEQRSLEAIQLMRYDAIRDIHGSWFFMETNTCCPGGVIHCAAIRQAWMNSCIGRNVIGGETIIDNTVDSPYGFVRFVAQIAKKINPTSPNIGILSHGGKYTNEVESLKRAHAHLVERGEIDGVVVLGDTSEVICDGEIASLNGVALAVIYNKLDQLQIDPTSPRVAGWVAASRCAGTEFLNSCGALYLTEAKRVLALMSDPYWRKHLNILEDEFLAITRLIPYTRLLETILESGETGRALLFRNRASFVLKADSLTRGAGVHIGEASSPAEWPAMIEIIRKLHGVAQLKCNLPSRTGVIASRNDGIIDVREYYGIDVFMFGDDFAGLVSRAHTQQIFNIGSGGRESPLFIVGKPIDAIEMPGLTS